MLRDMIVKDFKTRVVGEFVSTRFIQRGLVVHYRAHDMDPPTTGDVRGELLRMEAEGLVQADRTRLNSTKWRLL